MIRERSARLLTREWNELIIHTALKKSRLTSRPFIKNGRAEIKSARSAATSTVWPILRRSNSAPAARSLDRARAPSAGQHHARCPRNPLSHAARISDLTKRDCYLERCNYRTAATWTAIKTVLRAFLSSMTRGAHRIHAYEAAPWFYLIFSLSVRTGWPVIKFLGGCASFVKIRPLNVIRGSLRSLRYLSSSGTLINTTCTVMRSNHLIVGFSEILCSLVFRYFVELTRVRALQFTQTLRQ